MEAQRTTVTLEPDVLAGVAAVRQQRQLGLSEAVNLLAREGLARFATGRPKAFRQRTADIGLRVDVSNIAEALDLLDGEDHR